MSARVTNWCRSGSRPTDRHESLEPGEDEVLSMGLPGAASTGVYIGAGMGYREIGCLRICRLCACVYMEEVEP